jgi:hypothetical protein
LSPVISLKSSFYLPYKIRKNNLAVGKILLDMSVALLQVQKDGQIKTILREIETLSINKSYFIIVNKLRESWEHFKLQTIPLLH